LIRPDGLRVNLCARCETWFISPAPVQSQLDEFYARYFERHRRAELHLYRNDPLLLREMAARDPLSDEKVRVIASLISLGGKKTLDAGFGLGQTLVLLKKLGAEVSGIDLDPEAVAFVRAKLGIRSVRTGDLLSVPEGSFYDLVTLHDVVEHPLKPLTLLQRAAALLAHGGLLSVWTPNASFAQDDPDPLLFRVDLEHMQYFSFSSCGEIAHRVGLEIVHLEATGHPRLKQVAMLSGGNATAYNVKRRARRVLRFVPGIAALNALRKKLLEHDNSTGRYHLFCIYRKRER